MRPTKGAAAESRIEEYGRGVRSNGAQAPNVKPAPTNVNKLPRRWSNGDVATICQPTIRRAGDDCNEQQGGRDSEDAFKPSHQAL